MGGEGLDGAGGRVEVVVRMVFGLRWEPLVGSCAAVLLHFRLGVLDVRFSHG